MPIRLSGRGLRHASTNSPAAITTLKKNAEQHHHRSLWHGTMQHRPTTTAVQRQRGTTIKTTTTTTIQQYNRLRFKKLKTYFILADKSLQRRKRLRKNRHSVGGLRNYNYNLNKSNSNSCHYHHQRYVSTSSSIYCRASTTNFIIINNVQHSSRVPPSSFHQHISSAFNVTSG